MTEMSAESASPERGCAYRILRYTPNLVRDEWVNIGVLVFDPQSGERRLRLIEEQAEYARVRRLHPQADERVLRRLRDDLENRFESAYGTQGRSTNGGAQNGATLQELLRKWDDTLANVLQLAPQKGVLSGDLDAELERLYADHVAPAARDGRAGVPGSRGATRAYCTQVFKQARVWNRIERSIRAEDFTFPGDPMRFDYGYRRNGTRGFVQTLSVTRAAEDAKLLAYTAGKIQARARFASEFTAVTDVPLLEEDGRHRFVRDTLREVGVEPIPVDSFAVWVAKLKPLIQ
jgi:DUF3037 family protein